MPSLRESGSISFLGRWLATNSNTCSVSSSRSSSSSSSPLLLSSVNPFCGQKRHTINWRFIYHINYHCHRSSPGWVTVWPGVTVYMDPTFQRLQNFIIFSLIFLILLPHANGVAKVVFSRVCLSGREGPYSSLYLWHLVAITGNLFELLHLRPPIKACTVDKRVVRILLGCFLVFNMNSITLFNAGGLKAFKHLGSAPGIRC